MLVNGIHLLPDLSGALLWPKERLLALADPRPDKACLDRLIRLLRQVQPNTVIRLGGTAMDHDSGVLHRVAGACSWIELDGDDAEWVRGDLTFRASPRRDDSPGEVAGGLHPPAAVVTAAGGMVRPCFVSDGRRLILPTFAAATGCLDVLDATVRPLFKRGFHVIMLGLGRLHSYPRARLDSGARPSSSGNDQHFRSETALPSGSPSGTRFKLM